VGEISWVKGGGIGGEGGDVGWVPVGAEKRGIRWLNKNKSGGG